MKLSIIIPVFNKWNFTKSCLNDLSKLSMDNHEVIVIDNGSTDETRKEIHKPEYDFVRYTRSDENLGFAVACNTGFLLSSGHIIMFLNNDIKVRNNHNNWTDSIFSSMEENMLVGPTGGMVDDNFNFLYETNDSKKKINYMSGWCLSAFRNTFNKLRMGDGPFSDEFGLAYFEDTDLGFRASRAGIGFKLVDIPVVHFGRISSNQINTHKLYSEARAIFTKKWTKNDVTK